MALKLRLDELIAAKSAREGQPITQKKVAQDAGINESTLSRYANGFVTSFSGETIEKLMDYFGVGLDELFVREKEHA